MEITFSNNKLRLKVRFWHAELDATGYTGDVSNSGLFLVTPLELEIGTRLHFEIQVGDEAYFAEGRVVRRKSFPRYARQMFPSGLGIRLLGLNEALRDSPALRAQETDVEKHADEVPSGPLQVDLRDVEQLRTVYERDIVHGGLLVATLEQPELDSELSVPILLPEPNGQITCSGTVVMLNDSPPSIALRLHDMELVRARLQEILERG